VGVVLQNMPQSSKCLSKNMKYILGISFVIIVFLALHFIYTEDVPQDTASHPNYPTDCPSFTVINGQYVCAD
jgi:hypothetical protein